MKKGLAYALVGFLSFSMLQTQVCAYENAESEIVIESSDATSDEISDANSNDENLITFTDDEKEAPDDSSTLSSADDSLTVSGDENLEEQALKSEDEESDEASAKTSDTLVIDDSSDSASTLNTSSIADAPEDEDLLYEESFYSESDLFYDSYGNAASMLASMDIVAIDGHTYHISDFSEEYVCVF